MKLNTILPCIAIAVMVTGSVVANIESSLPGDGFVLHVASRGGLVLEVAGDRYAVDSDFSFPGETIGYHRLHGLGPAEQATWAIRVDTDKNTAGIATVEAKGRDYSLSRHIEMRGHFVRVRDTLINRSNRDLGILLDHTLRPQQHTEQIRLCGAPLEAASHAENPTVFLRSARSALATVAEDNLLRCQFFAQTRDNEASFGTRHTVLPQGARLTLEWSIYPFAGPADYFTFINRLREDLGVNRTLHGPGGWFDATRAPFWNAFEDDRDLRAVLERSRLKVILMSPWLDYENIHRQTRKLIWRDEFKSLMKRAIAIVRKIDPKIKILASLEAPFVGLPDELVFPLYEAVPEPRKQGYQEMTEAMFAIFKQHPNLWAQWGDSLVWNREGLTKFELYFREGRPMVALTVRPIVGNGQHDYLMEQARFVIEEVGFDGYYVDSFTGAQDRYYGYSYDKPDRFTADIDRRTGKITRRYTDMALAGTGSRKAVIDYGVQRGKMVLVNGHPITRDTQALGHLAFNESEWVFEPLQWLDGVPPWEQRPCEAHLSAPLALGFRPLRHGDEGKAHYAEIMVKGAIAFLRHGVLYFHYAMDIPRSGPGSGEYGPFNHMFPITPMRLGEGFVEGRERIVTCVSESFTWRSDTIPKILLYDLTGRCVPHDMQPLKTEDGWHIDFQLDDWQQIAIAH